MHAGYAASWLTSWKARIAPLALSLTCGKRPRFLALIIHAMAYRGAEGDAGQPVPLPNVSAHSLALVVRYNQTRVAEAGAAKERHGVELERQSSVAEAARLLATEAEKARAAASERALSFAEAAAEAQRGGNGRAPHGRRRRSAEATAQHHAAAEAAEHLVAEAAEAERLAAAAEASLHELCKSATAEAGAPAALGGTGEVFAGWEETFIAQMKKCDLLQLIMARPLSDQRSLPG